MEIVELCSKIARLCSSNGEPKWSLAFSQFVSQLESNENEKVKREILGIYKGMGSFNDLVLHKDGQPLIYENNELDRLRTTLYNIIGT